MASEKAAALIACQFEKQACQEDVCIPQRDGGILFNASPGLTESKGGEASTVSIVHSCVILARLFNFSGLVSSPTIKMGLKIIPTCQSRARMKGSENLNGFEGNLTNHPLPRTSGIYSSRSGGRAGGTWEFLFPTTQGTSSKRYQEHILPQGQDSLCEGKMRAPIFSLTRVTVRPRRGLKRKIKHPLRRVRAAVRMRGLSKRQGLLREQSVQGRGCENTFLVRGALVHHLS